jgi:hypothetical protein
MKFDELLAIVQDQNNEIDSLSLHASVQGQNFTLSNNTRQQVTVKTEKSP